MSNEVNRFSSEELLEVLSLSENATAIYSGTDLIIQTANDAMLRYWGKDKTVIGRKLEEALPELKDQEFPGLLRRVLASGITYKGISAPAELYVNGKQTLSYFDFVYRAVKNEAGQVYCILHTTTDVTEKVLNRNTIQESKIREQNLNEELMASNEELTAFNEELAAMNEELSAINEELNDSYAELQILNKMLAESESRFRSLVQQAPAAISVYSGPEMLIEIANEKVLALWGRSGDEVIGKPLLHARPELKGHPYLNVLHGVYKSGVMHAGKDIEGVVLYKGRLKKGFYDAIYHPIRDNTGKVTGIMSVVTDVTDRVKSRRRLETLYEQVILAQEAAQLGTFDGDLVNDTLQWNRRCRELFWVTHNQPVSFEKDFLPALHPDDSERVKAEIKDAFDRKSDGRHEVEFRVSGAEQNHLRWVRVKGKVQFNEQDRPIRFVGVVMDVTEQVLANHELKRTEEMLRFSIDAAKLGTWHLDLDTGILTSSPRLKELFGYEPDEELPYESTLQHITEDYRPKIETAVETAISGTEQFNMEYPVVAKNDNKIKWLRAMGKLYTNSENKPGHFSGILMDITEQKQDDLRKNDFIGMVSHELKTPLTSLKAYVQMLNAKTRNSDNDFIPNALAKVESQVNKMSTLINGFLNVTRFDSGKISLLKQDFNIAELIREVIEETALFTTSHHIAEDTCESLYVNADRDKIAQVISNLLSNAIKYSPRGKTIKVACERAGDMLKVSVKDEGMGIKPQYIDKLFERFYRVESTHTKTVSGFGIGLYLSAEIIERHNGRIWVESEAGTGSTFFFELPLT